MPATLQPVSSPTFRRHRVPRLSVCLPAARPAACRFQKLRKKAGLTVTDVVGLHYEPAPAPGQDADAAAAGAARLASLLAGQAAYLREALGVELSHVSALAAGHVVVAREAQVVGTDDGAAGFVAVLAAPPGSSAAAAAAAAGSGVQQMSLA